MPSLPRLASIGLAALATSVLAAQNQLIKVPNSAFGPNPSGASFYLYVPTILAPNPPILVNPHWCHGSASAAFSGTQLATLADTYGYIMIFPDSPNTVDSCWDVSSKATLTHNGGGHSRAIVSMVDYVLAKYNANPKRVFSMGTSSGAMMTNVLLGAYPDVFAAGSAWAGVAFGCFADTINGTVDYWNSACATGEVIKTGEQWKATVQAAYPSYTGWRPKMHVLHGSADTTLNPVNLEEEVKEWTTVLYLSTTTPVVTDNDINPGWTTRSWSDRSGARVKATLASGVTHNIPTNEDTVLEWFELKCKGAGCFSHGK